MTDGFGRLSRGLLALAGLLGAFGVGVGAAGAHLGGGENARLASFFLLLHGAALPGLLALPVGSERLRCFVAGAMACGTALFSAALAGVAFTGRSPLAGMAPLGGLLLILAWLALSGLAAFGRRREAPRR